MPGRPTWPWVQLALRIWPHHLATLGLSCFICKMKLQKTTMPSAGNLTICRKVQAPSTAS